MKVKISQFIPLAGTIGGFLLLVATGLEDIHFNLDPSHIWAYMGITLGTTVAHKATKKWRK